MNDKIVVWYLNRKRERGKKVTSKSDSLNKLRSNYANFVSHPMSVLAIFFVRLTAR